MKIWFENIWKPYTLLFGNLVLVLSDIFHRSLDFKQVLTEADINLELIACGYTLCYGSVMLRRIVQSNIQI